MIPRTIVFCVSLSRNGTLSLSAAMATLGWRAYHSPLRVDPSWYDSPGRFFSDTPLFVPELFRRLDLDHPDAYWIHTHRDIDSWLRSVQTSNVSRYLSTHPVDRWSYERVFPPPPFDPISWKKSYEEHRGVVLDHFGKRERFLSLRTEDLGWKPICDFLGVDAPNAAFPRLNRFNVCDRCGPEWMEFAAGDPDGTIRGRMHLGEEIP